MNFPYLWHLSPSRMAHNQRMSILILPLDKRLFIKLWINSLHTLLNFSQVKNVFVSNCSVEHREQENDRTSDGLCLPPMDGKVGGHTDLVTDNHDQSSVGGIVNHLTWRLYFSSIISQKVVSVHNVSQVDKNCTSHWDQGNCWSIENTNQENSHDLCVEITV